jgi:hypothetical protein
MRIEGIAYEGIANVNGEGVHNDHGLVEVISSAILLASSIIVNKASLKECRGPRELKQYQGNKTISSSLTCALTKMPPKFLTEDELEPMLKTASVVSFLSRRSG